jgi:hypothetical protein
MCSLLRDAEVKGCVSGVSERALEKESAVFLFTSSESVGNGVRLVNAYLGQNVRASKHAIVRF